MATMNTSNVPSSPTSFQASTKPSSLCTDLYLPNQKPLVKQGPLPATDVLSRNKNATKCLSPGNPGLINGKVEHANTKGLKS